MPNNHLRNLISKSFLTFNHRNASLQVATMEQIAKASTIIFGASTEKTIPYLKLHIVDTFLGARLLGAKNREEAAREMDEKIIYSNPFVDPKKTDDYMKELFESDESKLIVNATLNACVEQTAREICALARPSSATTTFNPNLKVLNFGLHRDSLTDLRRLFLSIDIYGMKGKTVISSSIPEISSATVCDSILFDPPFGVSIETIRMPEELLHRMFGLEVPKKASPEWTMNATNEIGDMHGLLTDKPLYNGLEERELPDLITALSMKLKPNQLNYLANLMVGGEPRILSR